MKGAPDKVTGNPSELYGESRRRSWQEVDPERQRKSRHSDLSGGRKDNDLNKKIIAHKAPAEGRGLPIFLIHNS